MFRISSNLSEDDTVKVLLSQLGELQETIQRTVDFTDYSHIARMMAYRAKRLAELGVVQ